jgi:hypothetical protein
MYSIAEIIHCIIYSYFHKSVQVCLLKPQKCIVEDILYAQDVSSWKLYSWEGYENSEIY